MGDFWTLVIWAREAVAGLPLVFSPYQGLVSSVERMTGRNRRLQRPTTFPKIEI